MEKHNFWRCVHKSMERKKEDRILSVRDSFFNEIFELTKKGNDILIVTPDLGAPSLDNFRKYFPEKFISVGIAEQNLISVSAGLSLSGKKVVVYGLNPFPITRAFDQIRCLLAEQKIPVTLCALNAGLCSAECGYTHMPIEDIGMMRTLSNIHTLNPSDTLMAQKMAREVISCDYPRYIRFDKAIQEILYQDCEIDFHLGFTTYGHPGRLCIITYGYFVFPIRQIVDQWLKKGVNIQLVDLFSLPVQEKRLIDIIEKSQQILTIEENVLPGGVGSYILELLSDFQIVRPVKRMGLKFPNGYYEVFTNRNYIQHEQKLDIESIETAIFKLIQRSIEMELVDE